MVSISKDGQSMRGPGELRYLQTLLARGDAKRMAAEDLIVAALEWRKAETDATRQALASAVDAYSKTLVG